MEPWSEWIVHFNWICQHSPREEIHALHLDIREIRSYDPIHDAPYMRNLVFMVYLDSQPVSYEAPCAFGTEQIFGAHGLLLVCFYMFQFNFDWMYWVFAIILESGDCPWSLHINTRSVKVVDEYSLDQSLV